MTRSFCFIITGTIVALSPFLSRWNDHGTESDRLQLTLALGGDMGQYASSFRCDGGPNGNGGGTGYVGCSSVGGTCSQCVVSNPDGTLSASTFLAMKTLSPPGGNGVRADSSQPQQACSNKLTGTCQADGSSPTNYTCVGTHGAACSTMYGLVDQVFGNPIEGQNPVPPGS